MTTAEMTSQSVNATSLGTFEIFADLSLKDRENIARTMRLRSFSPGNYVISADQNTTDVYFLVSGFVRVCAFSEQGKQVHFEDLTPGMMFGELAAIDQAERSCDCIVIKKTMLAVLSRAHFLSVIRDYPQVQQAVLGRLVGMLRQQMQRVFEFTAFSVNQRVRFELIRLASTAKRVEFSITLEHAPTHAEIAARISTHREAVTRELKNLENSGVITWRPGNHRINDIRALTELASS